MNRTTTNVRIRKHDFTVLHTISPAEPDVGIPRPYAEIEAIFVDDGCVDMYGLLAEVVKEEILEAVHEAL